MENVIKFDIVQSLTMGVFVLMLGVFIKKRVNVLERFFIPAPVVGGVLFALVTYAGHKSGAFSFDFDGTLKKLLMIAFFTTIGFSASLKFLAKGGRDTAIFLGIATALVVMQDIVGAMLAKVFGLNPLIGLAAGSVSLTGGHGTSAAFGPVLEGAGASGAEVVAIASATFGLVAGCLIGGPIGKKLMEKHNLKPDTDAMKDAHLDILDSGDVKIDEKGFFNAATLIIISMGAGTLVNDLFGTFGITLPAYIGPMIAAAIIRNVSDATNAYKIADKEISIAGNISLSLFLAMALMSMKLWQLEELALALIVILIVQTAMMAAFAYFVTFNVMGRDYDAAVLSCGHCGFGMGATANAMANMEAFTTKNYPSPKAFFVLPLVGALFIDFTNASIITAFMGFFG